MKLNDYYKRLINQEINKVYPRVKRGLFRALNGRYINADVNGSLNIMSKAVGDIIYSYIVDPIEACNRSSVITVKH